VRGPSSAAAAGLTIVKAPQSTEKVLPRIPRMNANKSTSQSGRIFSRQMARMVADDRILQEATEATEGMTSDTNRFSNSDF
jgi:hypothetical protein